MKRTKIAINDPEMGREINISGLPADMSKDCLNPFSRMGPKTKAKIMGPASKSSVRRK